MRDRARHGVGSETRAGGGGVRTLQSCVGRTAQGADRRVSSASVVIDVGIQPTASLRFIAALVGRASSSIFGKGPITAANLAQAAICLADIKVVQVNGAGNAPGAEHELNATLANQACFDATSLVKAYLQSGGTL